MQQRLSRHVDCGAEVDSGSFVARQFLHLSHSGHHAKLFSKVKGTSMQMSTHPENLVQPLTIITYMDFPMMWVIAGVSLLSSMTCCCDLCPIVQKKNVFKEFANI